MKMKTIKLNIPYQKAGLKGEQYCAELTAVTLKVSPETGLRRRPAVIICPGGGYEMLSDREAEPVAMRFASFGINAFILKYSLKAQFPVNALELAASIAHVRSNAKEYDIDPNKIIVCGFSAGGHLAASIAVHWNNSLIKEPFGYAEEHKPNGIILCYPVITSGKFRHEGSITNITRENSNAETLDMLSLEKHVSKDTPKTFIWHCADDKNVPVQNSLDYMRALSCNNITYEGHVYPNGGHGLSLADEATAGRDSHINKVCDKWFGLCIDWIRREFN